MGPNLSGVEWKASPRLLSRYLCLLSQPERARSLVLRPLHLPCCWAYPNSQRSECSWKNSPCKSSGFLPSFFCLQDPTPPFSQLQSRAGILFIIFCRACHAIFIKRRKGKARGVRVREKKMKEWSYIDSQWQCRKKEGSRGANLSWNDLFPWVVLYPLLLEHLKAGDPANTTVASLRGKIQQRFMSSSDGSSAQLLGARSRVPRSLRGAERLQPYLSGELVNIWGIWDLCRWPWVFGCLCMTVSSAGRIDWTAPGCGEQDWRQRRPSALLCILILSPLRAAGRKHCNHCQWELWLFAASRFPVLLREASLLEKKSKGDGVRGTRC